MKKNCGTKCYNEAGFASLTVINRIKWAKDQINFCRSYFFMEKFKLAQSKELTEAATDR